MASSVKFGYRGCVAPDHWADLDPKFQVARAGRKQSPIDIKVEEVEYRSDLKAISYMWNVDSNVKVINNGVSPTFYVTPDKHYIEGVNSGDRYELVQFHVHFSSSDSCGSEHTIDGRSYPAEIHFVHFKKSYGSFLNALNYPDGLMVIGSMLYGEESAATNEQMSADLEQLSSLSQVGNEKLISSDLSAYSLPNMDYYSYNGSLTTPGCDECVLWVLLRDPTPISSHAISALRGLESREGGLISQPGNYRPTQPLHARTITSSFNSNQLTFES